MKKLLLALLLLAAPVAASAQGFSVARDGTLRDPNGNLFQIFGIAVTDDDIPNAKVADLVRLAPKINAVRIAVGGDSCGFQCAQPNSVIEAYVATLTANHIVSIIENHNPTQPTAASVTASGEGAWYAALAADLKNNIYVMWESGNELGTQGLTAEHQSVYNAVRGTGSNQIVFFTTAGGNSFVNGGQPDGPSTAYATNFNVDWAQHYYNWMPCSALGNAGCNVQSNVNAHLASAVQAGKNYATSSNGGATGATMGTDVGEFGYIDYQDACPGSNNNGAGPGTQSNSYNCGTGEVVTASLTPSATGVVGGLFFIWHYPPCCNNMSSFADPTQNPVAYTPFYGPDVNRLFNLNSPGPFVPGVTTGTVTVNPITSPAVNTTFAVAGILNGMTTVPTLVYQDIVNGVAGALQPFPAGGGATSTTFSFTHPAVAAPVTSFAVRVQNVSNAAVAGTSNTFSILAVVSGTPVPNLLYGVTSYPTNVGASSPDTGASAVAFWEHGWGSVASTKAAPVFVSVSGCSCDGANGALADDQAWASTFTQFVNGQQGPAGGPVFLGTDQPLGATWNQWGSFAGSNPDGLNNADGTVRGQLTANPLTFSALSQGAFFSTYWWATAPTPPQQTTAWNAADMSPGITLSANNLVATTAPTVTSAVSVRSTVSKSTGKLCFEVKATVISDDFDVGIANGAYVLGSGLGLGGDTNGIGFDPNSTGGAQGVFFGNAVVSSGAGVSGNNDRLTICADLDNHLIWVTSVAMQAAGNPWNNSPTANPATATGGISFSGLIDQYFIIFNTFDPGNVAQLNTTGPFNVALPSGFGTWDQAAPATNAGPVISIFGANDNEEWTYRKVASR